MKRLGKSIQVISIILIINLSILYSLPNISANGLTSVKKLLCVHGWGGESNHFEDFYNISRLILDKDTDEANDFVEYYGTGNIKSIEYYNIWGELKPPAEGFESVDKSTPIEDIAEILKNYIIKYYSASALEVDIVYLDIVAHSMGGLIVRYMVKHFFMEIFNAGINITHIITIGSPNQGTFLGDIVYLGYLYTILSSLLGIIWAYFECICDRIRFGFGN